MTDSVKLENIRSLLINRRAEIAIRIAQVSHLIANYDDDGTRERQGRYMLIHSNFIQEEQRIKVQLEIIDG